MNADLKALADQAFGEAPDLLDSVRTLYRAKNASIHFHVMGKGQMCPLHFHPAGVEGALIVEGKAQVRSRFSAGQKTIGEERHRMQSGDLYVAGPFHGHEYTNLQQDSYLAILVASFPEFRGNFYIHDNDIRLLQGPKGKYRNLAKPFPEKQSLLRPFVVEPVGIDGGPEAAHIQILQSFKTKIDLLSMCYVVFGKGTLATQAGEMIQLSSHRFVLVKPGFEMEITAEPGNPLSIFFLSLPESPENNKNQT